VFDSRADDNTGHAVYVRATARELSEEAEIAAGLEKLACRRNESPKSPIDFMPPRPQRMYEAVLEAAWTNILREQDGSYFDERVVVRLKSIGPR
jgi:hypothetical protein